MSQASIDSVQSWLSFELEQRGIDAVVYTRHILNLFLNSHFTTDLHLAKKEANIFARLPPGPNKIKSKQKSRKRSNSSPFLDKIALKKEMAADCLRSASDDTVADGSKNMSVETLIDDLYIKLSNLNLLSDSISNADGRRVGKLREKRCESYQDAFPLLLDSSEKASKVNWPNNLDTVWNGQKLFKTQDQFSPTTNKLQSKQDGNPSSLRPSRQDSKLPTISQQLKLNGRSRRINNQRHSSRRKLHPFESAKKSPVNRRRNPFQIKRERNDFNKENHNVTKPHYARSYDQKKKLVWDKNIKGPVRKEEPKAKSFFDNAGATVLSDNSYCFYSNLPMVDLHCDKENMTTSDEKDIAHLYSWELPEPPDSAQCFDEPPCSKWFRDPSSGCLEFEPAYKSRGSADTSPSSVESWIWCPSPSLWDDNDDLSSTATQSRFETVYRTPIRSTSSDSQACQLWKDYEAIFIDVAQDARESAEKSDFKSNSIGSSGDSGFKPFKECDKTDPVKAIKKPSLMSSDAWHGDAHRLFVDDGENVSDFNGWFGSSPTIASTQSRKEIWLKNAEVQTETDSSLWFLQDLIDSAGSRFSSCTESDVFSTRFDDIFTDVSFQVGDFHDFSWLFGWDLPEPVSKKYHQSSFFMPIFPFAAASNLNFHQLGNYCKDAFGTSQWDRSLYDCDCSFEMDFPWALMLEESDKPPAPPPREVAVDELFAGQQQKHEASNSATSTLEECITENQAWKSSLRIGNMWQSISGIRQVDVLYSEKQADKEVAAKLQPSSCTHFRPIHENELDVSDVSIGSTLQDHFDFDPDLMQTPPDGFVEFLFSSPKKQHTSCDGCSDCDMKIRGLEQDLDNLLGDGSAKAPPPLSRNSLHPRFRKSGEDKSMQTSFEEHIRQIENEICETFSIRPPKANSR